MHVQITEKISHSVVGAERLTRTITCTSPVYITLPSLVVCRPTSYLRSSQTSDPQVLVVSQTPQASI